MVINLLITGQTLIILFKKKYTFRIYNLYSLFMKNDCINCWMIKRKLLVKKQNSISTLHYLTSTCFFYINLNNASRMWRIDRLCSLFFSLEFFGSFSSFLFTILGILLNQYPSQFLFFFNYHQKRKITLLIIK